MKMNKTICLVTIFFCLTISCSKPHPPDDAASASKQIANDGSKNIKNKNMITQKITPYLWVEKDAKAVADYYLSIFKDGKLKDFRKFDSDESGNDAGIETAVIEIAGMEFSILAACPLFKFNEAVSFVINTKDQAETDYYWDALTKNGGEEGSCGWCKDKYGLSWQVVPTQKFLFIKKKQLHIKENETLKHTKKIALELKVNGYETIYR